MRVWERVMREKDRHQRQIEERRGKEPLAKAAQLSEPYT